MVLPHFFLILKEFSSIKFFRLSWQFGEYLGVYNTENISGNL